MSAAAAGLVPARLRGRALSMITGGMCVGAAAGVPVGLALAYATGWRSTLWLVTRLGAVATVAVAFALPAGATASVPPLRARLTVVADRRVLAVAAVVFLADASSAGLYTYVAPLLATTLHVTHVAGYLWVWGLGGLVGSVAVGRVIDAWPDTRALESVVVTVLGMSLLLFSTVSDGAVFTVCLLFVWGTAGWGSLPPQQHRMLALRGTDGPVAVSLNASAVYLGGALGAGIGGLLLAGGLPVRGLAVVYGFLALVAAGFNLLASPTASPRSATDGPAPTRTPPFGETEAGRGQAGVPSQLG